jgi:WD40 repeat protein
MLLLLLLQEAQPADSGLAEAQPAPDCDESGTAAGASRASADADSTDESAYAQAGVLAVEQGEQSSTQQHHVDASSAPGDPALPAATAPPGKAAAPVKRLPDSYSVADFQAALAPNQLDACALQLTSASHLVSSKRNNLAYLDSSTVLTSAGNTAILYRPSDGSMTFLPGLDGGGVGAIAVHPTEPYFVVAEQCKTHAPNAYVYRHLVDRRTELFRVLRAGTEHGYACAAFSRDGATLALVGSAPDYMLTLWDWRSEEVILRSKAFSQDVYAVEFSAHFPGQLYTYGTGHVRFWRVASTFTGLKLVAALGKFGAVELSDVCAIAELPDGKVLSGTEAGHLLLWDGGLIKAVLRRCGAAGAHDSNIEVLQRMPGRNLIASAGQDGVVRLWDATQACPCWQCD